MQQCYYKRPSALVFIDLKWNQSACLWPLATSGRRVRIHFTVEPWILGKEISDWGVNLLEGSVWLKNSRDQKLDQRSWKDTHWRTDYFTIRVGKTFSEEKTVASWSGRSWWWSQITNKLSFIAYWYSRKWRTLRVCWGTLSEGLTWVPWMRRSDWEITDTLRKEGRAAKW